MTLPSPDTPPMTALEPSDPNEIPPFGIRGRLGAGGMGVVYAALSPDDHWVAVKVIRPEFASDQDFRRRFAREVRLMSRIHARCISPVLAFDTSAEQPWFATAFLPGPTLGRRVRSEGALPEAQARVLGVGMAEAIAAIHAAGVVHRDLKPANVILAPDGPRVLDFGIAHALDGTQLTKTGGLMGSPGWMSPERFRGGAGPEADVFSWGCLVAYAATGRPPFGTGSAEELMFRLLSEDPDLSGVPESLRGVVAQALAKDPADRPVAAELVRNLASAGGAKPAASPDEMATLVGSLIAQDWPGPHTSAPSQEPTPPPRPPGPAAVPLEKHPGPLRPRHTPFRGRPPARLPQRNPAPRPGPTARPAPAPDAGPRAGAGSGSGAGAGLSSGAGAGSQAGYGSGAGPGSGPVSGPPLLPPGPPPPSSTPPSSTQARPSGPLRVLLAAVAALLLIGGVTGWLLVRDGEVEQAADGDSDGATLPEGAAEDQSEPFVFALTNRIRSLDPALSREADTFRYSRQVFETLLRHDPGDGQIVGGVAEDWEHSDDGTEWTFHLREGVRFHDGDDLDSAAVCANYDRWHNFSGVYQQVEYTHYWQSVFGGFAENQNEDLAESNYVSCEATDDLTAVITVDEYTPALPGGFTLASFGLMSPSAVAELSEETIMGPLDNYSSEPVLPPGSGPFRITEWDPLAQAATLERFDDHWEGALGVETVVMVSMPYAASRRQALEAGEIHGYDLTNQEDLAPLREAGYQAPSRDPYNLLYLGYQQEAHEALEVAEVREALAHAVDLQRVVNRGLPHGSEVATQFLPEAANGWSPNVRTIEHSPELAQKLLADAGHGGLSLTLCYPNDINPDYMPVPEDIQNLIAQDLSAAGVTVEPVDHPWNAYADAIRAGDCPLYLHGQTSAYNDPHDYIGSLFAGHNQIFGFEDDDLFTSMGDAASLLDDESRFAAYQEASEQVMEVLPGLPIAHTPSVVVFSGEVEPPTMSPLPGHENFAESFWR